MVELYERWMECLTALQVGFGVGEDETGVSAYDHLGFQIYVNTVNAGRAAGGIRSQRQSVLCPFIAGLVPDHSRIRCHPHQVQSKRSNPICPSHQKIAIAFLPRCPLESRHSRIHVRLPNCREVDKLTNRIIPPVPSPAGYLVRSQSSHVDQCSAVS